MSIWEWLMSLFAPEQPPLTPHAVKQKLTERQMETADKLAKMKGVTRDEVLAEAYRKADRILADYTAAEEHRLAGRGR